MTISRNHDAPKSQIDRSSSQAHSSPGVLWRLSPYGDESTACYAVDLEDAVNAAVAMARKREL